MQMHTQPMHRDEWTGCSANCAQGTQKRTRVIAIPNNACGKKCLGASTETKTCQKHPKALDAWCEWDDWTSCSAKCGRGTRYRSFRQTVMSTCPTSKSCSEQVCICHVGLHMSCHQKEMHVQGFKVQTEHCSSRECDLSAPRQDCNWEWSSWSACSAPCKSEHGKQTQRQELLSGSSGSGHCLGFGKIRERPCGISSKDCVVGNWTEFTRCSHKCGGEKTRTREILTHPNECGEECPALEDRVFCQEVFPVDCQGRWTQGKCSRECGKGVRPVKFEISVPANECGQRCLDEGQFKIEHCEAPYPDPVDCEAEWAPWQECSKTCRSTGQDTKYVGMNGSPVHAYMHRCQVWNSCAD